MPPLHPLSEIQERGMRNPWHWRPRAGAWPYLENTFIHTSRRQEAGPDGLAAESL